jgi:Xrn1 helical domain/Exoribonuclease Xrn1 D1 domain/Xrn1 SH3-like domain
MITGPMLSDLRNLPAMFHSIKFEVGTPILPFQQLMSCLPPGSAQLVPKPYQFLMTNPDSPILEFYPVNFEVDMNGKKNPWEGVNLLPFIEINRLLDAIKRYCPDDKLTQAEIARNTKGRIYCYTFDLTCTDTIESPSKGIGLMDITSCNSRETVLPEYESEGVSFEPKLLPGTQIPYPGFPSLNVLPIASTELVPIGVDVFGMKSKYPTMVLKLHEMPELPPVEALAGNVMGKSLFINWPMMHEAKVVAISDETTEVRLVKGRNKVRKLNKIESDRWRADSAAMMQGYLAGRGVPGSGGVQIGEIRVRIKLLPLQGMKTNRNNGSTKKLFGNEEADIPLQLALWQAPAPDPRFMERGPTSLADRFPVHSNVALTKGKYRGCVGTVVATADENSVGVRVQTMPPEIPFGLALARSVYESYISSADAARILKIHPGLFGKITGVLMFEPGKYDLGLNLKSSEGLCVAGFTRQKKEMEVNTKDVKKAWDSGDSVLVIGSERTMSNGSERPDERITWEYTPKAIRLVNEYRQKFPQLFTALIRMPNEKKYDAIKVFGPNGAEWLPVIREWLNNVESAKLPRTPISTDTMSKEAVSAVEKASSVRNLAILKKGYPKESLIKIPGSAIYRENSTSATDVILASDHNNNEAPELGDRVVNLCASGIPFGARGTVVGIHQATTGCVEVVMDEEFVGGTNLQGLCSNFRGKLCVWAHLLRITVDDSKGVVDKMVPNGSGKAAVDKILKDIMKHSDATTASEGPPASSLPQPAPYVAQSPAAATAPSSARSASVKSATRAESTGKGRASSAARDKQAGWTQALGPPAKGIGFESTKKPKGGGFACWKNHVTDKKSAPSKQGAAELKKILGVGTQIHAPTNMSKDAELKAMLGVGRSATQGGQPATQLKGILGVGSMAAAAPSETQGAAAGLRAMLGVGAGQTPVPPPPPQPPMNHGFLPPPPPPASTTAADKLLQLMAMQQPQLMPPPPMPMQPPSSFNFTYVEEGKDAPNAPTHSSMPVAHFPHTPPMQMMMPMYGQMHPMAHMGVPQYTLPGFGMMPPQSMPPPGGPVAAGPVVVSDEEFPPLGGGAPIAKLDASTTQRPSGSGKLVPSNVKA